MIDLIYPKRCPICQDIIIAEEQDALICSECRTRLPYVQEPRCMKCGKGIEREEEEYCRDCRIHPRHYIQGFPLFDYVDPVREGIHAWKYRNRREYTRFYTEAILERFGEDLRKRKLDAVLPVPLHRSRFRQRGYNQAELLARQIGRELSLPVYSNLLVRSRKTVPQKELNDRERMENLKSAFHFHENGVELNRILLVDDIYTTGATIEACTQVLQKAGIQEVFYVSVCIGRGYID